MSDHDFTDCALSDCELCEMYVEGYGVGKETALREIEDLPAQGHALSCQCRPCATVRASLRRILGVEEHPQDGEPV